MKRYLVTVKKAYQTADYMQEASSVDEAKKLVRRRVKPGVKIVRVREL